MPNKSLPQARALEKLSTSNNDSSLKETYEASKPHLQELIMRLSNHNDKQAKKDAWAFFSAETKPKARQFDYKQDHFYLLSGNTDESTVQLILVMGFCHRYSGLARTNTGEGANIGFTKAPRCFTPNIERTLSLSQALTLYAYLYDEVQELTLNNHGMETLIQQVATMS